MGLGRLFNRSIKYTAEDTVTGEVQTFTIIDNIAPDWSTSGYRGGMSIPGAWRAANLLADLIGSVPWHAYRDRAGRQEQLPTPPLLDQPDPPNARMTSFSSAALDLLWDGNAIGIIATRNTQNWPTSAYMVPASMVGVRRVTERGMSTLPVGAIEYSVGTLRNLGSQDVIHVKGPCEPGALRGMGVLEAHLNTLNLAQEQGRQARSISQSGVPTGILRSLNPDVTDDDLRAAKAAWLQSQRDRTVAAMHMGTEFQPLAWNPEQLQMIEARKFTLTEWELIFGLPVGWLGGQTSSRTYSNIEQDAVNLLKFSLSGHIARFEQTLSLAFPRGTTVKANLDSILRADTLTRYQAHAIGIQAGFLEPEEVRVDFENRPPFTAAQRAAMKPTPPPAPEPATDPNIDPTSNQEEQP